MKKGMMHSHLGQSMALLSVVLVFLLSSCAPQAEPISSVKPTLFSVTVPKNRGGELILQGRYLGDGSRGQDDESYVVLGANTDGTGGLRVSPNTWTPSKITLTIPEGAGYGFTYVVVRGNISNALPVNIP